MSAEKLRETHKTVSSFDGKSEMRMRCNRHTDNAITYTRCVAMGMIILCHYFQYFGNALAWWLNVGVQVFLTMSGYLYGKKSIGDVVLFLQRRTKRIVLPYYLFLLPTMIAYVLFAREELTLTAVVKSLFLVGEIKGIGHLWFVRVILYCYVLVPYLQSIRFFLETKTVHQEVAACIFGLALLQIIGILTQSFIKPDRISCFIIGYFVASIEKRISQTNMNRIVAIWSAVAVLTSVLRVYLESLGALDPSLLSIYVDYAKLVLGTALFFVMQRAFSRASSNSVVELISEQSYYIYLVHQLFILSPFSLMHVTQYVCLNFVLSLTAIVASGKILKKSVELFDNQKKR